MNRYKVICCDVDGTLLRDDKSLSPENILWIRRAVDCGISFVIVSGRMLGGIRHFYQEIGITGPASGYNGCALYDEKDNLVVDHRVNRESAETILDIAEHYGLLGETILFDDRDWILESRDCYTYGKKLPIYGRDCIVRSLKEQLCIADSNKILVMCNDRERLNAYVSDLKMKLGDSIGYYPGPDFIEIIAGGHSKADAIHDLAAFYNISTDEIVAIGDDYNDMEMLRTAGLGVAVANAVSPVLEKADMVVSSNNDDGVADMIRRVFFENEN